MAASAWQLASLLGGAALTVATMLALGRLLLRGLGLKLHGWEEDALAFVVGGACLSHAVFLACSLGVASAALFLTFGAAVLTVACYRAVFRSSLLPMPPLPRAYRILWWLVFGIFGILYLVNAMAPEMSPDGSGYHLGLVARYLASGGFRGIAPSFYASMPQAVEMLFLFAFAFGRHSAAALVHLAFTLVLAVLMVCYGRRFGLGPAAACASLVVFVTPVVGKDGASAYNDVAVACIAFASYYLLQLWRAERNPRLLALAALCAGFAFAAKYTGFVAILYVLVIFLASRPKARLHGLALVSACAAVMIAPWMLKNWATVRNPVAPFFNSIFPNPHVQPSFEREYRARFRRYELKSRSQIPLEVTVRGAALNGLIGPVFLLAPISLLALRSPQGRQALLAAAMIGLAYSANIGTRFLIPVLPFLSLALMEALIRVRGLAPVLAVLHAFLSLPPVARAYAAPHAWLIDRFPAKAALRLESEEAYLDREFPPYSIARLIEHAVPPGESVFTFGDVAIAYTSRDVRTAYESAPNRVLADILWTPVFPGAAPETAVVFRFAPTRVQALRIEQTANDPKLEWSVAEVRVGGSRHQLHLRAEPNPWDAALAADGSLATRWRALEPAAPGMFLEIDLQTEAVVSHVELQCAGAAENTHQLRLLGRAAGGAWKPLAPAPTLLPARVEGLRREAARQIRRRGASHIVVFAGEPFASDYARNIGQWGFTLAAEAGGASLYRLPSE
jgi:hypothetical protein